MKKREKLAIIHQYYPNAMSTIDAVNQTIAYVEDILDLETKQIMMADSICSDDVNSIQYPARALEFLGPFKLGGLDGYPFAGLTGMSAYASHVPTDGAAFIYYGPHIGITTDGKIGEIQRMGQLMNSDCCGASKAGLEKLLNNQITVGTQSDLDYQMNTLEQILLKEKDRIIAAKIPIKEATEVLYEAIHKRIHELVAKTKFNCKYILLTGSILINSDKEIGSFTSAKNVELINMETGQKTDLLGIFG
jgi:DNA-dependent RNA polymerase auxiliary subunit epsilon